MLNECWLSVVFFFLQTTETKIKLSSMYGEKVDNTEKLELIKQQQAAIEKEREAQKEEAEAEQLVNCLIVWYCSTPPSVRCKSHELGPCLVRVMVGALWSSLWLYICIFFPLLSAILYLTITQVCPFVILKCYKNEHSFEICHWAWSSKLSCKISWRYDQPFSRKWRLKLLFLIVFRIFLNWNCHFRPGLWKARCDFVKLYVLQSYRSCTFCKHKTRGKTQFWIGLAAPCTLTNHHTLPFIIFLTPVSCDGSNRLWRQRLLLLPCPLWCHKQMLFGVIRPLTGGKCRTFRTSLNDFVFIYISAFTAYFTFRFFVNCFLQTEWPYSTQTVFILIAL